MEAEKKKEEDENNMNTGSPSKLTDKQNDEDMLSEEIQKVEFALDQQIEDERMELTDKALISAVKIVAESKRDHGL